MKKTFYLKKLFIRLTVNEILAQNEWNSVSVQCIFSNPDNSKMT